MKLKIAIAVVLVALFFGMGSVVSAEDFLTCPDGTTYNKTHLYQHIVPSDFPEELLPVLCNYFCADGGITGMHQFPGLIMASFSADGSLSQPIIFTLILDTIGGKYRAIVKRENNQIDLIWISTTAPTELKKYLKNKIKQLNKNTVEEMEC